MIYIKISDSNKELLVRSKIIDNKKEEILMKKSKVTKEQTNEIIKKSSITINNNFKEIYRYNNPITKYIKNYNSSKISLDNITNQGIFSYL